MKRILALLLAGTMAMGGCSTQKEKPLPPVPTVDTAINIQLGGEPDKLDPAFAVTAAEQSYIIHLLEGLTTLDDKLLPQRGVAESWERTESEAGAISYTFKLDPAAKWSDGQAVKPEDFIYAWKRVLSPATKSPLAYQLYPISGAKAVHQDKAEPDTLGVSVTEEGGLLVQLEGECPDFLQRLATAPWMPLRESAVTAKKDGWYYDTKNYLTNGPYTIENWERDQQITMTRSDSYHDTKNVKAKRLNFVLMQEDAALLEAFKNGTVQLATTLPLLDIEALEADARRVDTLLGSYLLAFNTMNKPFDDARVRRALGLAVDRAAIVTQLRDGSVPATGLVPTGALVEGADFRQKSGELVAGQADLAQAQQLLKEAGHEGGKDIPTIRFLINDEDAHLRVAQSIAKMWEPLGVTVKIDQQNWDDYLVMREDGKFDVTRAAIFSDGLYPGAFFDSWAGENLLNFTGYNSTDYNTLIDLSYGREPKAAPETTEGETADPAKPEEKKEEPVKPEEKKEGEAGAKEGEETEEPTKAVIDCLAEAEKLLIVTDAVVIPLTWYTNRYAVAPGLTGWRSYPTGYSYFGNATYRKPAEK